MKNLIASEPKRAFIYCRVSTDEQAKHLTSIDQQEADARKLCADRGIEVVGVFTDRGISGSDRNRPEFNRMLMLACSDDRPVDAVVACDMSRIARDLEFSVVVLGQLRRAGLEVILVYQSFENSHSGRLHQLVTSWQDEDAIVKASQNTRRGLRGTAKENFWTGGTVPLGYESRTVEVRGKKEKKRLFKSAAEAPTVRLIFDLAERGLDGTPMGGRAIAEYLNARGYTRRGKPFYNATVAGILSRPHYLGRFVGNKFNFEGKLLPEEEWSWVDCPALITQDQFDRVAALRAGRAPRTTAPRIVNGPTLLVGIARCGVAGCGCGMTIRTGKAGRYRYYSCHSRVNAGAVSCSCPNVRAEKLHELVMSQLALRIFSDDQLEPLLQKVLDTSDEARERKQSEIEQCETRLAEARRRLANLHDAIEAGTVSTRDPDIASRIKGRRAEIDGLTQTAKTLRQQLDRGPSRITPNAVKRFGQIVRERIVSGDSHARQQIARAFIKQVRVGPNIIIEGETEALAHGAAAIARSNGTVPTFDRKWCGREDSNFHGLAPTTTSTLRVYQFRHDRT